MMINGHGFGPDYLVDSGIILIILIPLFIAILVRQVLKKRFSILRVGGLMIFFAYTYALIKVTIFPVTIFKLGSRAYSYGFGKQYLANFDMFEMFHYAPLQILGNIGLLLPLSIIVAYLWPNKFNNVRPNIVLGLLTTLGIETIQLLMSFFYLGNRTFDMNDLILNSLGYLLGFVIYKVTKPLFRIDSDEFRIF